MGGGLGQVEAEGHGIRLATVELELFLGKGDGASVVAAGLEAPNVIELGHAEGKAAVGLQDGEGRFSKLHRLGTAALAAGEGGAQEGDLAAEFGLYIGSGVGLSVRCGVEGAFGGGDAGGEGDELPAEEVNPGVGDDQAGAAGDFGRQEAQQAVEPAPVLAVERSVHLGLHESRRGGRISAGEGVDDGFTHEPLRAKPAPGAGVDGFDVGRGTVLSEAAQQ